MKTVWFAALAATMCLEGLGRRYLAFIPSAAFYFLKDFVLLVGYVRFRPTRPVVRAMRLLYRGFEVFWVTSLFWTLAEMFNPSGQSMMLALIGIRSYWLWWLAPAVIATVLQDESEKRRAICAERLKIGRQRILNGRRNGFEGRMSPATIVIPALHNLLSFEA